MAGDLPGEKEKLVRGNYRWLRSRSETEGSYRRTLEKNSGTPLNAQVELEETARTMPLTVPFVSAGGGHEHVRHVTPTEGHAGNFPGRKPNPAFLFPVGPISNQTPPVPSSGPHETVHVHGHAVRHTLILRGLDVNPPVSDGAGLLVVVEKIDASRGGVGKVHFLPVRSKAHPVGQSDVLQQEG